MMSSPWYSEARQLIVIFLIAALFGYFTHAWYTAFLCASWCYIALHLYRLYQLDQWFKNKKNYPIPEANGIWGEIYYQLYRLYQRNRKRKQKMANLFNQFRSSTAAMPDAAVVLRGKYYEIEWMNKATTTLLGLRYPEDIGQPIINLIRAPTLINYLQKTDKDAPSESIRLISPANPTLILRLNLVPYGDGRNLLMARDITQLQRLEQIRSDFIANVSHELRTPLTVIAGFLETMRSDNCPDLWKRPLLLMAQQTARMRYIVEDLLLLSRLELETSNRLMQPINIAEMIYSIYEEAQILSGDQHHIHLDIDEQLNIYGYAEELRSAFSNLLSNAVRYTPPDGHIYIRWYKDINGIHFSVQDTGEGISAEHLPRLTERFYRVDVARSRSKGGTGLGLAIVKHVLIRHRAQLHIDSKLGTGSTFRCDFPLTAFPTDIEEDDNLLNQTTH